MSGNGIPVEDAIEADILDLLTECPNRSKGQVHQQLRDSGRRLAMAFTVAVIDRLEASGLLESTLTDHHVKLYRRAES